MKRLIASAAIAATLALGTAALATSSPLLAKEGELRDHQDDAVQTELVGREGELRDGKDNAPEMEIVGRGEPETEVQAPQVEIETNG